MGCGDMRSKVNMSNRKGIRLLHASEVLLKASYITTIFYSR